MTPGLTSVVIATYQHGSVVREAIASALSQSSPSSPVEVIVVNDGSTDGTKDLLNEMRGFTGPVEVIGRPWNQFRPIHQEHAGPSAARNRGLDEARGEFVMFLDADDVIAPDKVAKQLAAFDDSVGWVICDVEIQDEAKNRKELASVRYGYDDKELGGWIRPQLQQGNFIPIMAPLVRRSVIGDIRFDDRLVPEDWHFWCAIAAEARVRYVPQVLATYRKSRTGRSRRPKTSRRYSPNLTMPLRLNLGCGTPGTRSWHPMEGMENLDRSMGWKFEDGLGDFVTGSVAGITISHTLMYVPIEAWPFVFSEFARVLAPGGVVRITEDDATHPKSARLGGWKGSEPAVTLTDAEMVKDALRRAGFTAYDVDATSSRFTDRSLCQAQHGAPPDVFFVEGVRPTGVLFAPHNDDETLFAAFTVLKHRPMVVVCFQSSGDYGDAATREAETRDAMNVLGAEGVEQWRGGDIESQMREFDALARPTHVWAPDVDASHPDHRTVASAAARVFGDRVVTYHTYRDGEKVRRGQPVEFEPVWVQQKLRALARYTSQITHPRAHQFFVDDLREYYGDSREA